LGDFAPHAPANAQGERREKKEKENGTHFFFAS